MSALIVTPRDERIWQVRLDGSTEPLSEHEDATAALRAATDHARRIGGGDVLLRDRQHHVHLARRVVARDARLR
jgi:hypothetical protein